MNIKKITNFVIFLISIFPWVSAAQNCKALPTLVWPDELIHFYFKQPGLKIIPIPPSYCQNIKQIEIKNVFNKKIGVFNVKVSEIESYNDASLKAKQRSKLLVGYHSTLSKITNPYLFTDFMFKLLNEPYIDNYNKKIQFIYGDLKSEIDSINWNPLSFDQQHWNAKNINYDDLIQFYKLDDVDFISFDDDDGYFFPKASVYQQYISKYSKSFLLDTVFNINIKSQPKDRKVVVFSTYKNTIRAYNLISKLYSDNVKNVYWFNDANTKWIDSNFKSLKEIFKKIKIANTNEFLIHLKNKSDIKILDISKLEEFEVINIKNSIHINPQRLFAKEYKEYYLKTNPISSYNKLSEGHKKGGGYIFYGIDSIPKQSKIYIVGHHLIDPYKTNNITKFLNQIGYTDVSVVLEPISELAELIYKMKLNPSEYINSNVQLPTSVGVFELPK